MAWVKGNVFSRGLGPQCHDVLRNLYVCEVVQVLTWLEADLVVSSPWELQTATASAKSQVPQVWGQ